MTMGLRRVGWNLGPGKALRAAEEHPVMLPPVAVKPQDRPRKRLVAVAAGVACRVSPVNRKPVFQLAVIATPFFVILQEVVRIARQT
jgi:hypothetical protein